jgi:hypothetical protein
MAVIAGDGATTFNYGIGIGENTTTANSAYLNGVGQNVQVASSFDSIITNTTMRKIPRIGYSYYQAVETVFYGNVLVLGNDDDLRTTGLEGYIKA